MRRHQTYFSVGLFSVDDEVHYERRVARNAPAIQRAPRNSSLGSNGSSADHSPAAPQGANPAATRPLGSTCCNRYGVDVMPHLSAGRQSGDAQAGRDYHGHNRPGKSGR